MAENSNKKCPSCQMDIPTKATRCPFCRSRIKAQVTAKTAIIAFFGTMGLIVFLSIMSTPATPSVSETVVTVPVRQQVVEQAFDIPSLMGMTLSELEAELGVPDYNKEPESTYIQFSDIRTWEKTWNKNGYALTVTYNIDTKNVSEYFLGTDTDASLVTFRDTNNILKVGNLTETSPEYSLEFIKLKAILGKPKSETPEGYTGVIIRSK